MSRAHRSLLPLGMPYHNTPSQTLLFFCNRRKWFVDASVPGDEPQQSVSFIFVKDNTIELCLDLSLFPTFTDMLGHR